MLLFDKKKPENRTIGKCKATNGFKQTLVTPAKNTLISNLLTFPPRMTRIKFLSRLGIAKLYIFLVMVWPHL